MSDSHFDVIIIGSGTSAYYCASGLLSAGKKVAIVDERPFGGTCALRGCQPKKYLVANAEAVAGARHLKGKGIDGEVTTNWAALQDLKNEFLNGKPEAEEKEWLEKGVATFRSRAVLQGERKVTLTDGTELTAEVIVLATGSTSRRTDIPGKELIQTSDEFLELAELPKRVLFIGGGYISFEFAHVAAHAGAEVKILHRSARPLKGFDSDMVDIVLEAGQESGVELILNESPVSVEKVNGGLKVTTSSGGSFLTDVIIEATGRVPNLGCLEGAHGKVDHSGRGVTVNEFLQSTSNPHVYAIGDCSASGPMLATVADEAGKVAAQNILEGNTSAFDFGVLPSAAFTIPSLATVGLTTEQATEQGFDFRVNHGSTVGWPSSKRTGDRFGGYKVIIDNSNDRILGAHLARHNAGEVINIFALAVKYGIPAKDLGSFMWAYPTSTSDLKYMVG